MQESIFDLFGSRQSTARKHNSRQATSVSSVNSLGVSATANLKQKSLSVGGPTPLKRALGDASNRLQQSRPLSGKEENQNPCFSFSCQQKSPSPSNGNKSLSQKLRHKNDEPGLKTLTPSLKNLTVMSAEVDSKPAVVWDAKPEIFPDTEITGVEDDYEDLFPKKERLTNEDMYRVIMSFDEAEEPKPHITPPHIISWQPLPDITVKDMQSFEVNLLMDIEEQVSLPDIMWDIEDQVYKNEDYLRHTL